MKAIKKNIIINWGVVLSLVFYLMNFMFDDTTIHDAGISVPALTTLPVLLFSFMLSVGLLLPRKKENSTTFVLLLMFFFIWIGFVSIFYMEPKSSKELIYNIALYINPVLFVIYLKRQVRTFSNLSINLYSLVLFVGCSIVYAYIWYLLEGKAHIAASYYPLAIFPLLLLIPSKIIKFVLIVGVYILVFSSEKRGGVLALVIASIVSFLVYYLVSNKNSLVSKCMNCFLLLGMCISLYVGYSYVRSDNELEIVKRFDNAAEDGGSGRIELYESTFDLIINSYNEEQIIGHGYSTVRRDSPYKQSAHNDFLEITYDYGYIGLVLYILIHIFLIYYSFKLIINKSFIAVPFVFSYIIFLILSMLSIVILYPLIYVFIFTWIVFLDFEKKNKL